MSRFRLFDLNPAQETAVRTTEGPVLILAGAGTGKTRVITARAAYLLGRGVEPSKILAVTFTNKAANEMRQRLARMVESDQAKGTLMSTFHALCVRILRRDIEKLGYKKNFSIYDEGDQLGLIRKIITRTAARDEKLDPAVARNLISKAKNAGHTKARGEETLIGAVFDRYQAELKTLNAVDFDDLLLLTVKLLNEHADVKARWSNRFAYIMVDEFQDTNGLQLELVSLLAHKGVESRKTRVEGSVNAGEAGAFDSGPSSFASPANVCVVGDDDQSIYGWRGAEVSNILEFERHFQNPAIIKLEENYRSTNAILKTANALIKNNPRRRPKQLWSARGDGAKVRVIQMPDDPQEASFVANDIARRQLCDGTPWEKFAVLFRTNAQSRLIEQNLRTLRIPYRIIGGKSFFEAREVKDFLAYASCLLNTDDDVSLLRIINTPARGIGPSVVERAIAISIAQKKSLFATLQLPAFRAELSNRQSAQIDGFIRMLDEYETRLHEPLANQSAVLREFISTTGYMEDLGRSCKTPEETLKRQSSIHELLRWFDEHAQRSNSGLRGFLDEMLLRHEEEEEQSEDGSGVTLITLHAAKGLEFPHVYLIGLEEGMLPHERSRAEGTLDEERRLLYVGITRAMDALTLTWCRSRIRYGSAAPRMPSSFIKELPADSVSHIELSQILNAPVEEARVKSGFGSILASLGHGS